MGCPGPPLCCEQCCTHRKFAPWIAWSDNVQNRNFCGSTTQFPPAVLDHAISDATWFLLAEKRRGTKYRYHVQAWSAAGTKLWESPLLQEQTIASGPVTLGRICTDGSTIWVALATNGDDSSESTVYRVSSSDGSINFSGVEGAGVDLRIESIAPVGDGTLYIGHAATSGLGVGLCHVSVWDDDDVEGFGCGVSVDGGTATDIVVSGGSVYVGSTHYVPADGCSWGGFVTRYEADGSRKWTSYYYDDPDHTTYKTRISVSGSTVYYCRVASTRYGAMETDWGKPLWVRDLTESESDEEYPASICGMQIRDVAADGANVWLATCRWLVRTETDGEIADAVAHCAPEVLERLRVGSKLLTVVEDGSGNALGSGQAVPCDAPDDEDNRESTAVYCDEDQNLCPDGSVTVLPEWCSVNDCPTYSTNGRVSIGALCDQAKWPPCQGPGLIEFTMCDTTYSKPLTFVDSCVTTPLGASWTALFDDPDGAVTIGVSCTGDVTVAVRIGQCSMTVDNINFTCDGPFGYASVSFTFSGTCDECDINGCGAFGAESCETAVDSPCCDNQVPSTLTATFSSGACAGANGQTITIEWNGAAWLGDATINGETWSVSFGCNGTTGDSCAAKWSIGGYIGCQPTLAFGEAGCSCDPFSVTFITTISGAGCVGCVGDDLTVVITA